MSLDPPVRQWITDRGCIIQGVMLREDELFGIYCPVHKEYEHVHSFDREIDMRSHPSKAEEKLAQELREQYCRSHSR